MTGVEAASYHGYFKRVPRVVSQSADLLPLGVTGNTPDSGSGESWFDPRRGNSNGSLAAAVFCCPSWRSSSPHPRLGSTQEGIPSAALRLPFFVAPPGDLPSGFALRTKEESRSQSYEALNN